MEDRFSPIHAQTPNPNTIACKDCIYRDRATIEVDGAILPVGVTKDECDKYEHKPPDVLFLNKKCNAYERE